MRRDLSSSSPKCGQCIHIISTTFRAVDADNSLFNFFYCTSVEAIAYFDWPSPIGPIKSAFITISSLYRYGIRTTLPCTQLTNSVNVTIPFKMLQLSGKEKLIAVRSFVLRIAWCPETGRSCNNINTDSMRRLLCKQSCSAQFLTPFL
jgi:hypothetical protein